MAPTLRPAEPNTPSERGDLLARIVSGLTNGSRDIVVIREPDRSRGGLIGELVSSPMTRGITFLRRNGNALNDAMLATLWSRRLHQATERIGSPAVLVINNAEALAETTINGLFALRDDAASDADRPRLLLFGTPQLLERLQARSADRMLSTLDIIAPRRLLPEPDPAPQPRPDNVPEPGKAAQSPDLARPPGAESVEPPRTAPELPAPCVDQSLPRLDSTGAIDAKMATRAPVAAPEACREAVTAGPDGGTSEPSPRPEHSRSIAPDSVDREPVARTPSVPELFVRSPAARALPARRTNRLAIVGAYCGLGALMTAAGLAWLLSDSAPGALPPHSLLPNTAEAMIDPADRPHPLPPADVKQQQPAAAVRSVDVRAVQMTVQAPANLAPSASKQVSDGTAPLVLIAEPGDTLPGLYVRVYRDFATPPSYDDVKAANPQPLRPGMPVQFPRPPSGWAGAKEAAAAQVR